MVLNFQCMIIMFFFCLVTSSFSETAINQDAEMCNAAMDQGNPQVINNVNIFLLIYMELNVTLRS